MFKGITYEYSMAFCTVESYQFCAAETANLEFNGKFVFVFVLNTEFMSKIFQHDSSVFMPVLSVGAISWRYQRSHVSSPS